MGCPPNCSEEEKAKIVAQHNPPSGVLRTNLKNIKQEINLGSQALGRGSLEMAEYVGGGPQAVKMNSLISKKGTIRPVETEVKMNSPISRKGTLSEELEKKEGIIRPVETEVKKSKIETLSDEFTKEQDTRTGKGTIYDPATW